MEAIQTVLTEVEEAVPVVPSNLLVEVSKITVNCRHVEVGLNPGE
jgi:hypothetical protein